MYKKELKSIIQIQQNIQKSCSEIMIKTSLNTHGYSMCEN